MSEPFLGTIMPVAFQYAPSGWMTCQGQQLSIQQNSALYALLATTFGGNGTTTFNLPNLQGRTIVGQGVLNNVVYQTGQAGGAQSVTLTTANLPAHNHTATTTVTAGGSYTPPSLKVAASGASAQTPTPNMVLANSTDLENADNQPAIYAPASTAVTIPLGGFNPGTAPTPNVSVAIGNTGSSAAVSVMQPFLPLYYVIAIQGLFPTRD